MNKNQLKENLLELNGGVPDFTDGIEETDTIP